MQPIQTYSQAINYLFDQIPQGRKHKFPGELGLQRAKYLLKQLGDPQNKLKVIHIAGTSGKGSTAFFTSTILKSLGFKVGLVLSPHLLDIRERFQLNNSLIPKKEVVYFLNKILPAVEKTAQSKFGHPTYFEILVALAYYIFHQKKADYAVIETGMGGLLDGTNVVTRPDKIAIITKIGHDHTKILGKTLDQIAAQKAGIIHPKNTVITCHQYPKAMQALKKTAFEKQARLFVIDKTNTQNISLLPTPSFSFTFQDATNPTAYTYKSSCHPGGSITTARISHKRRFYRLSKDSRLQNDERVKIANASINNIQLNMLGSFQIQNCSLTLAAVSILSQRDKFELDHDKIKNSLRKAIFPGRMQILRVKSQKSMVNGQMLILDGAHNPQKMATFTKSLKSLYPNQKFDFLIAFKRGKKYQNMLRYITPLAESIIVTSFFSNADNTKIRSLSEEPDIICNLLDKLNFQNYHIIPDSKKALEVLLKNSSTIKITTGSLYLIGEIYPLLKTVK